jgi:hypothetical protein
MLITCATDVYVRMEVYMKISELFIQFVTHPTEERSFGQTNLHVAINKATAYAGSAGRICLSDCRITC